MLKAIFFIPVKIHAKQTDTKQFSKIDVIIILTISAAAYKTSGICIAQKSLKVFKNERFD